MTSVEPVDTRASGSIDPELAPPVRPSRLRPAWLLAGVLAFVFAGLAALAFGPASLPVHRVALEVLDHIPGLAIDSGLTELEANIVWEIRLPRVVLGLLVGGLLALSGASYQGVFRNPLVDPYLLGVAAGAGLGATLALVGGLGDGRGLFDAIPVAAFAGGMLAVVAAYTLAGTSGPRGTASLLLAGIAMASFFTAMQTYVQQRESETLREVYSWILGSLTTAGWTEVLMLAPYAIVALGVLVWFAPMLDVLAVGDDEAAGLGMRPARTRLTVLIVASLAASAAVAVSGLIGFVGLVVPHAVRGLFGASNRVVLPLSFLFGAAFLALTDLVARTAVDPAELPIGVVTAFIGAPFFLWILRKRSMYP